MSKYHLLALLAISALTYSTACKKKSDPAPRIDTVYKYHTDTIRIVKRDTIISHDTIYTTLLTWQGDMGAQNNALGSFFSTLTGQTYYTTDSASFAANQVDLSFGFTGPFGGGTPELRLISLDARRAYGLTKVTNINNVIRFSQTSFTPSQFDTASAKFMRQQAVGTNNSVPVQQGSVYSFTTIGQKKGLIYIQGLYQGVGYDGQVTIRVRRPA